MRKLLSTITFCFASSFIFCQQIQLFTAEVGKFEYMVDRNETDWQKINSTTSPDYFQKIKEGTVNISIQTNVPLLCEFLFFTNGEFVKGYTQIESKEHKTFFIMEKGDTLKIILKNFKYLNNEKR